MPVITAAVAAVAAVSFATAATAVATIATAVVAVSTAVGVMGLAVTAVGMITKNEDLLKAGKIMGYVGLAGGLAGGAIGGFGAMATGSGGFLEGASAAYSGAAGHMSDAWDSGVGSWFSGDTANSVIGPAGIEQQTLGKGIVAGTNPDAAQAMASSGATNGLDQEVLGRGISAATPVSPIDPGLSSVAPQSAQGATVNAIAGPQAPAAPVGYTVPDVNAAVDSSIANAGATMTPGSGVMANGGGLVDSLQGGMSAADKAAKMWAETPDWMKMSMMTTGGQGIAGLASGYFAGASAEEKLEFEKLVNAQRQGQIDLQNRNAQMVPRLRFNGPVGPAGLINTVGRR